jgi:hypothetical protein
MKAAVSDEEKSSTTFGRKPFCRRGKKGSSRKFYFHINHSRCCMSRVLQIFVAIKQAPYGPKC